MRQAKLMKSLIEVTVGTAGADVVGATGRAIQLAVDAVAYRGGGTVRVLPGEYELAGPVRLRPNVSLVGERDGTILRRGPLVWSPLAVDADTSETQITPQRAEGFEPGMGICLWDRRSGWLATALPYTVTAVEDGVLRLAQYIESDRLAVEEGRVVNYFPLILGICADDAGVRGFTVDGAVKDPDGVLHSAGAAVVYFWRSRNVTVRRVIARNGPGDGLVLAKSSVGATVEECEVCHNAKFGIHPGSHSAYCAVHRCDIHHNGGDGLYICWGVRHSRFEDNRIHHNGGKILRSGLSIGHKDTDNLIVGNRIYENKKFGVCFREKTEPNGAHRNVLRENTIENNGSRADELTEIKGRLPDWESVGCGVSICGVTRDVTLERNRIRETRRGDDRTQQHAVCIRPGVSGLTLTGNSMEGHAGEDVLDDSGDPSNQLGD